MNTQNSVLKYVLKYVRNLFLLQITRYFLKIFNRQKFVSITIYKNSFSFVPNCMQFSLGNTRHSVKGSSATSPPSNQLSFHSGEITDNSNACRIRDRFSKKAQKFSWIDISCLAACVHDSCPVHLSKTHHFIYIHMCVCVLFIDKH